MLRGFDGISRYRALTIFLILLHAPNSSARQHSLQGHGGADVVSQPDVITVPDGTPLTLKLEKGLSSTTAKIGDTVEFTVPYPARINGLVIVPKGTAVSGTVVEVTAAGRASRNGEVEIALGTLTLPSGEIATLRQVLKPESTGKKVGTGVLMGPALAGASLVNPFIIPALLFGKGDEKVYQAGDWTTVYFNGPMSLNREASAGLEPPPYKGPPQVFIKNRQGSGYGLTLFSDQEFVGELSKLLRLELEPGSYSLSTSNAKEQALRLEVREDQQYWVERERGGLFAKDSQQHRDEIEVLESAPWVRDRNFTSQPPAYKGPAQINFVDRDESDNLFCSQKYFYYLVRPLRIELNPGTYLFNTHKKIENGLRIQVQEDHQYWIEIKRGKLFVKDFQRLHNDVEDNSSQVPDLDLRLPSPSGSCVPVILP